MSHLDVAVLQILRSRAAYSSLGKGVPRGALQETTKTILSAYGRMFKEHPSLQQLTAEVFIPYFQMLHPKLDEDRRSLLTSALSMAFATPVPHSHDALIPRLAEARLALDLQTIGDRYAAGEDIDVLSETRAANERVEQWAQVGQRGGIQFVAHARIARSVLHALRAAKSRMKCTRACTPASGMAL